MSRLNDKKSVVLVFFSIIILGLVFYYLGSLSANASESFIEILPNSASTYSTVAGNTEVLILGWQNPEAALVRDLSEEVSFADFNKANSTFINSFDAIKAVTPSEEGIKYFLDFFDFDVPDRIKSNEINNAQLRFSFAAKPTAQIDTDEDAGLDKKLFIEYQSSGGWQNIGIIDLNQEISNSLNGGYFLYALPIFRSWEDLKNLAIRFRMSSINADSEDIPIFLDAVWIEVEYNEISNPKFQTPKVEGITDVQPLPFGNKGTVVKELKEKRTLHSKTFLKSDSSYQTKVGIGPIHYPDENDRLEDINPNFVFSNDPEYDYEVTKGFYKVKLKKNLNSENLVEYRFHNFINKIELQDLNWSNKEGERELISQPQPVEGMVWGNSIKYLNAYGTGIGVEFLYHPQYLGKYLVIDSFDSLPPQSSPGTFPYLEFNFKMTLSDNLDIYINGQKWDGKKIATQEKTEFKDKETGETQFAFKEPYSEDAQGNKNPIILSFEKEGDDVLISKQIDKNWLENAIYPIKADTVDTIYLEGDVYDMYTENDTTDVDTDTLVWCVNTPATGRDCYWAFPISGAIIGSTINSVTFTGYNTFADVCAFDFWGLQQEDSPALEGAEQPGNYTRTTASVAWTVPSSGSITSPDISSIFDEWVSDYGHSSPPDYFGIVLDSVGGGNNRDAQFYDYSNASYSNHTYLTIDYTPSNETPEVANVSLDGGTTISLVESVTTSIQAVASTTDEDGQSDIASVIGRIFRSGVTSTEACILDDNNCYEDLTCVTSSCTGAATSCHATCSFDIWYYAEPTDGTGGEVDETPWSSEHWVSWIKAIDSSDASSSATNSAETVDVGSLLALAVSPPIDYDEMSPEEKNDPLSKTTTVTNTGNCSLDLTLYGVDMASGGDSIAVGKQKYATSSETYALSTSLSVSPGAELELDLPKTTASSSPATDDVWWGIEIPAEQVYGTYSGTTTFEAKKNEVGSW